MTLPALRLQYCYSMYWSLEWVPNWTSLTCSFDVLVAFQSGWSVGSQLWLQKDRCQLAKEIHVCDLYSVQYSSQNVTVVMAVLIFVATIKCQWASNAGRQCRECANVSWIDAIERLKLIETLILHPSKKWTLLIYIYMDVIRCPTPSVENQVSPLRCKMSTSHMKFVMMLLCIPVVYVWGIPLWVSVPLVLTRFIGSKHRQVLVL